MTNIIYCNECIHRPVKDESDDTVLPPEAIDGYNDYTCPFINQDDWYYNRMPPDGFFCKFGEKQKTFIILKNMDMPDCCADCPFFDENNICVVTGFHYNETQLGLGKRMAECSLQRVSQVDNLTYKEIPNDQC